MARKMKTMDGNNAAAHVSYAFTDVAAIYGLHFSCHLTNSSFKDYQWIYLTAQYPVHRPAVCRTLP